MIPASFQKERLTLTQSFLDITIYGELSYVNGQCRQNSPTQTKDIDEGALELQHTCSQSTDPIGGEKAISRDFESNSSREGLHEQACTNSGITTSQTQFPGNLDKTRGSAFAGCALRLVDLREHSIGWLRYKSGSETCYQTGTKVDGGLHRIRHCGLVKSAVDGFRNLLVHYELGHCIWDPEVEYN